jgi:DNA-binding Xre family transcriptional regulator
MESNLKQIRHNLWPLMIRKNIKTLAELSRQTGVDYRTLQNFNSYIHKKLDPELICKLCKTLECSIGDLLFIEDGQAS